MYWVYKATLKQESMAMGNTVSITIPYTSGETMGTMAQDISGALKALGYDENQFSHASLTLEDLDA
jgi:hypothetical protein